MMLKGPKGIDVSGVMHDFEWARVNSIVSSRMLLSLEAGNKT